MRHREMKKKISEKQKEINDLKEKNKTSWGRAMPSSKPAEWGWCPVAQGVQIMYGSFLTNPVDVVGLGESTQVQIRLT